MSLIRAIFEALSVVLYWIALFAIMAVAIFFFITAVGGAEKLTTDERLFIVALLVLRAEWKTFGLSRQIMAWGHRIGKRIDDPSQRQSPEEWAQEWKSAMDDLRKGQIGFWMVTVAALAFLVAVKH